MKKLLFLIAFCFLVSSQAETRSINFSVNNQSAQSVYFELYTDFSVSYLIPTEVLSVPAGVNGQYVFSYDTTTQATGTEIEPPYEEPYVWVQAVEFGGLGSGIFNTFDSQLVTIGADYSYTVTPQAVPEPTVMRILFMGMGFAILCSGSGLQLRALRGITRHTPDVV